MSGKTAEGKSKGDCIMKKKRYKNPEKALETARRLSERHKKSI
ncbi:MAG: hypothetical protein ACLUZ6_02595 [Lachnospira eligens]